jgi:hypothetical protein
MGNRNPKIGKDLNSGRLLLFNFKQHFWATYYVDKTPDVLKKQQQHISA